MPYARAALGMASFLLAAGCNAVLGLEPPTLHEGGGAVDVDTPADDGGGRGGGGGANREDSAIVDGAPAAPADAAAETDGNVTTSPCGTLCIEPTPLCDVARARCVQCLSGARRCAPGDVPEECTGGTWTTMTPCSGSTPVCTGGTCAALRVTGALVTLGAPSPSAGFRLREQALERSARACALVKGAQLCVSGGIHP
jgi:hypothetical protein